MLGNHLDLINFLTHTLQHSVSYPVACSLKIDELTMNEQEYNCYLKFPASAEESAELSEKKVRLLEFFRKDKKNPIKLGKLFKALGDSWDLILKLREQYSDFFDFRFLCHAQELPREKIETLLDPKIAKLISFIPSPKYPDCLFMMGTIQTLAKIQNKILEESKWLYKQVNNSALKTHYIGGISKNKIGELIKDRDMVLGFEDDLTDVILSVTYTDLSFNKDSTSIHDFELFSSVLSQKILKGQKLLHMDELDFKFQWEFGVLRNWLTLITSSVTASAMESTKYPIEFQIDSDTCEEVYLNFSRYLQNLVALKSDIKKTNINKNLEKLILGPINLGKSYCIVEPTVSDLEEIYFKLEQYFYKTCRFHLDPEYLSTPVLKVSHKIESWVVKCKKAAYSLQTHVIRLIMTQLLTSTSEQIGETSLTNCVRWSELGDEEPEVVVLLDEIDEILTDSEGYLLAKHSDWFAQILENKINT